VGHVGTEFRRNISLYLQGGKNSGATNVSSDYQIEPQCEETLSSETSLLTLSS
jgi:hypothetical protein